MTPKKKEYQNKWIKKNPWRITYYAIVERTRNKNSEKFKRYGAKGIKCLITVDEVKSLWIRDKAHKMIRPSIDRINPKGNYTVKNCRFIEHSLNSSLGTKVKTSKYIGISHSNHVRRKYWRGEIGLNGKRIKTPWFKTEKEAVIAYKKMTGKNPTLRIESTKPQGGGR